MAQLTEKEKVKINLDSDIERLTKQMDALQGQIDTMAKQTEEAYAKRRVANQEVESLKQEAEAITKKIQSERTAIEKEKKLVEGNRLQIVELREKLNEDKDQFAKERVLFRKREEELKWKEDSYFLRNQELEKKEKALEEKADLLAIETKKEHEARRKYELLSDELETQKNVVSSKEAELNQKLAEIVSLKETALSEIETERKAFNIVREDHERDVIAKKTEFRVTADSLEQRELAIVRKEKDIHEAELTIKSKLEKAEIAEGRKKK